jgi:hypothetical protein
VDRFEDRALILRKGKRPRMPAPADVPHSPSLPDGSTVQVLAPPAAADPTTIREQVRALEGQLQGDPLACEATVRGLIDDSGSCS